MANEIIKSKAVDELNELNDRITFLKKLVIAGNAIHEEELGYLQQKLEFYYEAYSRLGYNIYMDNSGKYIVK